MIHHTSNHMAKHFLHSRQAVAKPFGEESWMTALEASFLHSTRPELQMDDAKRATY